VPVSADVLASAFSSKEWRDAVDALFEATGLVIGVLDAEARAVVYTTPQCLYCGLTVPSADNVSEACFGQPPQIDGQAPARGDCRGGLPCYVAPVEQDGSRLCTVIIGGFVASTRDRKRLFEKLLGRGVAEGEARKAVRQIPVMSKREVEAFVRMVVAQAKAAVRRSAENQGWAGRLRELELFAEAGQEFSVVHDDVELVQDRILARAMGIASADSGTLMLLRPGTDILEVVAARGESCSQALGERIHVGEGIAGRVAQTRRGVLITGDKGAMVRHSSHPHRDIRAAVSVPLERDERLIGVLNVSVARSDRSLEGDALVLLERFAKMSARVLDSSTRQRATRRALFELMHLGEYAKSMSTTSDLDAVAGTTASVLEKAFDFELGGIVVTGWGRDQAAVTVIGDVPESAVEEVIYEAAGWDLDSTPLTKVQLVTHRGETVKRPGNDDEWTVMSTEIMVRQTIVGYLFVAGREVGLFDADDQRLLTHLADHAAAALEKTALLARLRDDFTKTIAALSVTLDAGEHAARGHSDRVMDYAMAIGERLGLDLEDIEVLRFAGLLHDVGKLGVNEEILLKPANLTDEEAAEMRRHSQIGASILEQIEFLDAITPVVLHHHEHWDGQGYPGGLAGEEIPLLARVLAVADSFDAMTSERTYRRRLSFSEARAELRAQSGRQFDGRVVEALLEALDARALAGATGLLVEKPAAQEQLPS